MSGDHFVYICTLHALSKNTKKLISFCYGFKDNKSKIAFPGFLPFFSFNICDKNKQTLLPISIFLVFSDIHHAAITFRFTP